MKFNSQKAIFENMKQFLKSVSSSISDFTTGSVLYTIFYSISQSIGNLNDMVRNVYNAIFISTATGDDLDLKVADYGITRKESTVSTGTATFYRDTAPTQDFTIPLGAKVKTISTSDTAGIEFETTEVKLLTKIASEVLIYREVLKNEVFLNARLIDSISSIEGKSASGGLDTLFIEGQDFELDKDSYLGTRHFIKWLDTGKLPMEDTEYEVNYVPLAVEVGIQSRSTGSTGNVAIGSIIEFIDNISGIEKVYNFERTSGGTETETDAELRTRVPLYLSSLAKATKNAIKSAALSVAGVVNATVSEPTFPDGLIRVFIDDGSGGASDAILQSVRDIIDGTVGGVETEDAEAVRAAGIGINIEAPTLLSVSIDMVIEYDVTLGLTQSAINSSIRSDVIDYLQSLSTGATVYRSKIIDTVMGVTGVVDIDIPTLSINSQLIGNLSAKEDEVPRTAINLIGISENG